MQYVPLATDTNILHNHKCDKISENGSKSHMKSSLIISACIYLYLTYAYVFP